MWLLPHGCSQQNVQERRFGFCQTGDRPAANYSMLLLLCVSCSCHRGLDLNSQAAKNKPKLAFQLQPVGNPREVGGSENGQQPWHRPRKLESHGRVYPKDLLPQEHRLFKQMLTTTLLLMSGNSAITMNLFIQPLKARMA